MTDKAGADWQRASHAPVAGSTGAPVRIAVTRPPEGPSIGFLAADEPASPGHPIILPPQSHVMTFAPTGAGKLVSCVAPALLQHEGPAIVLDPKGEIAAVTARRRREMGQSVHVIDPFGVSGLPVSGFNPLDIIEPGAPDAADEAKVLAHALMPSMTEPKDVFWRSRAVHMLTAAALSAVNDHPPGRRNLSTLRDIMHRLARNADRTGSGPKDGQGAIISRNPDVERINDLMGMGALETIGGIIQTAMEGVGFVQGPLVERSLATSAFRLDDVTEGVPMTIYLVLPPHMLTSHGVMLRLWLSTLFSALMRRRAGPALPTLLLLDEAAQLGPFQPLQTAITLLRGYGVQTWSLWQDPSQLVQNYPTAYRTMLSNCRVLQVFGASAGIAWQQAGALLGVDLDRVPRGGDDGMVLMIDGREVLAGRIDYRTDPELSAMADPNPFHAPPRYPLRRRLPDIPPNAMHNTTQPPSAIAEISAALGRL